MNRNKFLQLLFEPGELTCFATTPYDTALSAQPAENSEFFSINAMQNSRADANVISYRNFLIELDSVPLQQQIALVTAKIPVSTIVFSGSKSYHFIVSLQTPLASEAEYRKVWRGLFEAIPEADKSTKNPSRLSRLPGTIRASTGLMQTLEYVGSRVALAELPKPSNYHTQPETPAANIVFVTQQLNTVLAQGVDNYIEAHFGGRNQFFYWLGKRLSELGQSKEQKKLIVEKFYARLVNKRNFGIVEAFSAARVKF